MTAQINLDSLTGGGKVHNLSGHLKGLAARDEFGLDKFDENDEIVEIIVPSHIFSVSPSFVQGMFSASVKSLGNTYEGFTKRYRFVATDMVQRQLQRGMERILTTRYRG